jgi:hypothetical protein
MRRIRGYSLAVVAACWLMAACSGLYGQGKTLSAKEAKDHIGEHATVCGRVATARYASSTRGSPTFLDLEAAYPKNPFTIVIWGENRAKFGTPEEKYRDKDICATGTITSFRGSPEMVLTDPGQISIGRPF